MPLDVTKPSTHHPSAHLSVANASLVAHRNPIITLTTTLITSQGKELRPALKLLTYHLTSDHSSPLTLKLWCKWRVSNMITPKAHASSYSFF